MTMGEVLTLNFHEGKCRVCGQVKQISEGGRCLERVSDELSGHDRALDLALKKIVPRFAGMFAEAETHMRGTLDEEGKTSATFKVAFEHGNKGLAFKCKFVTPGIAFEADSDLEFVDTARLSEGRLI
jgi:hypothetical protein